MPDTATPQPQPSHAQTAQPASEQAAAPQLTVAVTPTAPAVDRQWFYVAAGQRVGPIGQVVFLQIVRVGQIGPETMVWSPGLTDWVRASTMADLASALSEGSGPRAASMTMPLKTDFSTSTPSMLVPTGRSGWAIAAGYLGLFSVLGVAGPFALVCGILGLREIKRNEGMGGKGRAIFGIVMGSLGIAALTTALIVWLFSK